MVAAAAILGLPAIGLLMHSRRGGKAKRLASSLDFCDWSSAHNDTGHMTTVTGAQGELTFKVAADHSFSPSVAVRVELPTAGIPLTVLSEAAHTAPVLRGESAGAADLRAALRPVPRESCDVNALALSLSGKPDPDEVRARALELAEQARAIHPLTGAGWELAVALARSEGSDILQRKAAVRALRSRLEEPRVEGALADLLEHPFPDLSIAAAHVLRDERADAAMIRLLMKGPSKGMRSRAYGYLEKAFETDDLVRLLRRAAEDADVDSRVWLLRQASQLSERDGSVSNPEGGLRVVDEHEGGLSSVELAGGLSSEDERG